MRHAREIIRLRFSCVSTREIARRLGMARSTVREALKRTETAGLSWPLPEDMSDGALEVALYASRRSKRGHRRVAEPDRASVHREPTARVSPGCDADGRLALSTPRNPAFRKPPSRFARSTILRRARRG
jgi:Helix-turn-helix domain